MVGSRTSRQSIAARHRPAFGSLLIAFVGIGDRLERRLHKRDLAVWREIEAHDIDGLPDLIEDDVLGGQGCDLRVEAGDFDPYGDRRRAFGEFSIGIEVEP